MVPIGIGADFRFEVPKQSQLDSYSAEWVSGWGRHGECGARAYNGGLGAEPLVRGSRGRSPLKLKAFWMSNGAGKFSPYGEGPSGGSRAAAAVADGCREVDELPSDDCSRSTCISATTIPVAELVDIWPPISSGSA